MRASSGGSVEKISSARVARRSFSAARRADLAAALVRAARPDRVVEREVPELRRVQRRADRRVAAVAERVDVRPDVAGEERRVLRPGNPFNFAST